MDILRIEPVKRQGMKFLISLYGMSETGKTYSALKLACGMEPDPAKRLMLDTEGGQRGRAYVDAIPGGYLYAQLTPPFTPKRYIEALDEIEAAGVTVVVVDSVSHVWFAEGGILDMAEQSQVRNDLGKWIEPKRQLRKFHNRVNSSGVHLILCARAKQPMVEVAGENGKKKMVPGDVVPIQEKTMRYDMTIMAQMLGDGLFTIKPPAGKCPGSLRPVFAAGERMDEAMGKRLIEWLGAEQTKTPSQKLLERAATGAAEAGKQAFRAFWKDLPPDDRSYLKPMAGNFESIAQTADEEAERRAKVPLIENDDDPFASTTARTESTLLDADELLLKIEGFAEVGALMAWWTGDAGASIERLEVEDKDAWGRVCDAYEAMRNELAANSTQALGQEAA